MVNFRRSRLASESIDVCFYKIYRKLSNYLPLSFKPSSSGSLVEDLCWNFSGDTLAMAFSSKNDTTSQLVILSPQVTFFQFIKYRKFLETKFLLCTIHFNPPPSI